MVHRERGWLLSRLLLPAIFIVAAVLEPFVAATSDTAADKKAFIESQAEVNTECKTCPRSLCPNVVAYSQEGEFFNVTCWTRGTKIMGDE